MKPPEVESPVLSLALKQQTGATDTASQLNFDHTDMARLTAIDLVRCLVDMQHQSGSDVGSSRSGSLTGRRCLRH